MRVVKVLVLVLCCRAQVAPSAPIWRQVPHLPKRTAAQRPCTLGLAGWLAGPLPNQPHLRKADDDDDSFSFSSPMVLLLL